MTRPVNEVALDLAQIAMLKKYVAGLETSLKAEMQKQLGRGTAYARIDDMELATVVVVAESDGGLVVADERAFLAWVKQVRPTAIVETVRKSDRDDILAQAKATGDLPPGVESGDRKAGYVQVKQSDAQIATLKALWASGRVAISLTPPKAVES